MKKPEHSVQGHNPAQLSSNNPYQMEIPKPSAIRNYLYEYVLIALTVATSTMFYMLIDLNKYVRTDMLQMHVVDQQTIKDNTNIIQQFMNYERFNKQSEDKKN